MPCIGVLVRCACQSFSRHLSAAWLERLPLCCSPRLLRHPDPESLLLKHAAGLLSLHILPEGCVRGTMQDINWNLSWGSHSCRTSSYIEASFPCFFAFLSQSSAMDLDYSTFSIRDALGAHMQCSSTTTKVASRNRTLAEQEAFPPRNQADAARNLDDVDATSFPIHHSFDTSLQHAHYISPLPSFANMPQNCIPAHPGFAIHDTSSAHVYQEHRFQDPPIACVIKHQPLLYGSTYPYPSSEMPLAPGEHCSNEDQVIETASFSRTAGQGYQCDALSLDTTFDHPYLSNDDNTEMTHPTSPPFSLDDHDSMRPPWIYQHPPSYPFPAVLFPLADYSPVSSSFTAQETVYHSSQLNAQEFGQLDMFRESAGLSRPSHYIKGPTELPPRPYSADPPRTGVLGKRLRRRSSDSDLTDRDTTITALPQACDSRSESRINRTVVAPRGAQPPVYLRAQHVNVSAVVEPFRHRQSVPKKVDCDDHLVDESVVRIGGQPLLYVYECQWDKDHSPCGMHIEGDQASVTDHLARFHGFTGGEGDTTCLWDGCTSKKRTAMKGTSIARHLVTHIGYKIKCTACNVDYAREDACRRSHANARSDCQRMQIAPVHGTGVIALRVSTCEPPAKKRHVADAQTQHSIYHLS